MNYDNIYQSIKSYCIWSEIIEFDAIEIDNYFKEESIMTDNLSNYFKNKVLDIIEHKIVDWNAVFPKINNKSAKDAEFIIPKMQCFSLKEMFILLKSSSIINKEIKDSILNKRKIFLTIKKWYSIDESNEFRVLIYDYKLKGISQRNISDINTRDDLDKVRELIVKFIADLYKKINLYSNLIIDVVVYVNSEKVKLIDITDCNYEDKTLLFSYDEIKELKGLELLNSNIEKHQDLLPIRVLREIEDGAEKTKEEIEAIKNQFPIELTEYSNYSIDKLIEKAIEESNNLKDSK